MVNPTLFHGMTEKQYEENHSRNYSIPNLWTTGPIQAFVYSLVYRIDDRAGILIWAINEWTESNFKKTSELVDKPIFGLRDVPVPDWYSCILNPFNSQEDRDSKIKKYSEKDLEEYVRQYIKDKSAWEQVLQLARPKP
ncbi:MAG: hypothetical protein V1783_09555 [Bacteroidota bacterium]